MPNEPVTEPTAPLWALAAASREKRAGWLAAIEGGMVSVADLLVAAKSPDGHALRQIKLADLLYALMRHKYPAAPAHARRASRAMLADVLRKDKTGSKGVTVAWLLSNRVGGKRLDALAEALARDNRQVPNARWPY
jgi:hypothetical protein